MFFKSVFKVSTLYFRSSRLKTRQNYDRKWGKGWNFKNGNFIEKDICHQENKICLIWHIRFTWFILKYLDFNMSISIFLPLLWASKMLRAGLPTHLKKERNMLKKQLSLNVQTCHGKTLSHSDVWICHLAKWAKLMS